MRILSNPLIQIALFLSCLFPFSSSVLSEELNTQRYGLWIEAEGRVKPLNDRDALERLLSRIRVEPFTDLYVQIYRHGRSWFSSELADATPYYDLAGLGIDPLQKIIEVASSKGIRVHAWLNALRLGHDTNARVLKYLKEDDILSDSKGVSLLETQGYGSQGCRPDTPGIWLNPESERVQRLLEGVVSEIIAHYPELSGVHLDMIRGTFRLSEKFGGGKPTCKMFGKMTEAKFIPYTGKPHAVHVVRRVRRFLDTHAPHFELSAAVLSNQDKAVRHAGQNWPSWLEQGLVDSVVTMNYTKDVGRFVREVKAAMKVSKEKVLIGIGAWLALHDPGLLKAQYRELIQKNASGYVLFSHANLDQAKGEQLYRIMRDRPPTR